MDLICYCHLRWNFVYQRPQHLISRFANNYRVFYIEEPTFSDINQSSYSLEKNGSVNVITPQLAHQLNESDIINELKTILDKILIDHSISNHLAWYYTPIPLKFSRQLKPDVVVYDCMDELSNFKFAPPELKSLERELLTLADVVFTGGETLYQAKKNEHKNIYAFPSSIDKEHFAKARLAANDPEDQKQIPHPRFGFYGVIDERFDLDLLNAVASAKPNWNFVIIGPVVKIDPATLPKHENIFYLGGKTYDQLPEYLRGWDVAMIPFLLNESTKFISPTKTPEYLAGGKPVISASIADVVSPYGNEGFVHIADNAANFIAAGENILADSNKTDWLIKVDNFLQNNSWDITWNKMNGLIEEEKAQKIKTLNNLKHQVYV
ncbi:MAG: glycosyltransferase family 1 protein [Ginsengibacter sp.]